MNWHDLSSKYGPAVKRILDANGWHLVTMNPHGMRQDLQLQDDYGEIVHPFDVLCALWEEGVYIHIETDLYEPEGEILGVEWRVWEHNDPNGEVEGQTGDPAAALDAAIPHALKALNDKIAQEAAG